MSIIPVIIFSIVLFSLYQKNKRINVPIYILIVYILSGLCSFWVYNNIEEYLGNESISISFFDGILFSALILLSIYPFVKYKEQNIKKITLSNDKVFDIYCIFAIISFWIVIVSSYEEIKMAIVLNSFGDLRNEFYANMLSQSTQSQAWYLYLPNIFVSNYVVTLAFYFYSITFLNKPRWFNFLLLLSTFGAIFQDLLQAARTSTVFYLLIFVALFVFFAPHMQKKVKRQMITTSSIFLGFILLYFVVVTISRFGDMSEGGGNALTLYMGEPFVYFSKIWNDYDLKSITFDRLFPFTSWYLLGHKSFDLHIYRDNIASSSNIEVNKFITHYGDAVVDFGQLGCIIYAVLLFILLSLLLKRRSLDIRFEQLIIFVLCLRIPIHGMFAYVYSSRGTTLAVLLSLLFFFLFRLKKHRVG